MFIPDVDRVLKWLKEIMDSGVSADGVAYASGWNFVIYIRRETDGTCQVSLQSESPMEEVPLITFVSAFPYSSAELALAFAEKIQREYLGRISNTVLIGFSALLEETVPESTDMVGGSVGGEVVPGSGSNVVDLEKFRRGKGV